MTLRSIAVLLLLQRITISSGQADCDCHSGDVPIVSSFQFLQSPPDSCNQNCVWKISATDDDQHVQLTIQQVDSALALTVLNGADENSSPLLSSCDTTVQGSVCYSSGRYLIVKSDTRPGALQQGSNIVLRLTSVTQSQISNGSNSGNDHTWLIVGLSVGFVLLVILIIAVIFLVYVHFKKRRESLHASSSQANSDMIFVLPSSPSTAVFSSTPSTAAPSAPLRTSLMDINEPPKYEGTLHPSNPEPEEYFMKK